MNSFKKILQKQFISLLFLCFFLPATFKSQVLAKEITQYTFNFKGFALKINDDVADEKGNHLLVGEIHVIEEREEKRDTLINRLFDLKGVVRDDRLGILITTDKKYKIIQIARSYIGEKIIYDPAKKQFTVGALFFDYLKVGTKSFSAWQPVIMKMDIELNIQFYFIQRPYSCILKDLFIEKDQIRIFTKSKINDKDNNDEKAEIITVSTSKTHKDSARPWIKVLDIISTIQTPYNDVGGISLTKVSKVENGYYFTTSNLDQSKLKGANHLYHLKNDQLIEVLDFPDILKFSHNYSDWIIINEFFVPTPNNYIFLTHIAANDKEVQFTKTDTNFRTLLTKKIPLNDYADFDKMILLPNGNILILSVNKTAAWSYFLYDENMELIKEINSTVSKKYYPLNLKAALNNNIECLFFIDAVNNKDCLLQIVNLN